MKKGLLICFLLFNGLVVFAQKPGITKDSLSISKELSIHKYMKVDDICITFSKVKQDSRCPKEVNCVRAGEANLEVIVQESSKKAKTVMLTIDASGVVTERNNLIAETSDNKIYGFSLTPYPVANRPIATENYILEIVIKPKPRD
ncbi:hypothetical protein [uncultured Winogradskyella sp.]|uniref:hypothetical protein n=1 Tax=uncultured Winogradskyella sp. TaxID=395353 RepID=UPI00351794AE